MFKSVFNPVEYSVWWHRGQCFVEFLAQAVFTCVTFGLSLPPPATFPLHCHPLPVHQMPPPVGHRLFPLFLLACFILFPARWSMLLMPLLLLNLATWSQHSFRNLKTGFQIIITLYLVFLMFSTTCVTTVLSLLIKMSCRSSDPLPLVDRVLENWLREPLTQPKWTAFH